MNINKVILTFLGILFMFSSWYVTAWDYQSPSVATPIDTIYQLHAIIGFIGLIFSAYIFFKIGDKK